MTMRPNDLLNEAREKVTTGHYERAQALAAIAQTQYVGHIASSMGALEVQIDKLCDSVNSLDHLLGQLIDVTASLRD